MKVISLKIATVEGKFVKIGQQFELAEKQAKKYIDAGFVEEMITVSAPAEEPEPETKTATKAKTK